MLTGCQSTWVKCLLCESVKIGRSIISSSDTFRCYLLLRGQNLCITLIYLTSYHCLSITLFRLMQIVYLFIDFVVFLYIFMCWFVCKVLQLCALCTYTGYFRKWIIINILSMMILLFVCCFFNLPVPGIYFPLCWKSWSNYFDG